MTISSWANDMTVYMVVASNINPGSYPWGFTQEQIYVQLRTLPAKQEQDGDSRSERSCMMKWSSYLAQPSFRKRNMEIITRAANSFPHRSGPQADSPYDKLCTACLDLCELSTESCNEKRGSIWHLLMWQASRIRFPNMDPATSEILRYGPQRRSEGSGCGKSLLSKVDPMVP